jgi:hypothetical protein
MTSRFPGPDGFLAMHIDVIAAAIPSVQHRDTLARAALAVAIAGEMEAPIREVTQRDQLVIPFHAHVATAIRPAS